MKTTLDFHGYEHFKKMKVGCPECGREVWQYGFDSGERSSFAVVKANGGEDLYLFICETCKAKFTVSFT